MNFASLGCFLLGVTIGAMLILTNPAHALSLDDAVRANVHLTDGRNICSGVIVDKKRKLILTASHCIDGVVYEVKGEAGNVVSVIKHPLRAKLTGQRTVLAMPVAWDWENDVAVLMVYPSQEGFSPLVELTLATETPQRGQPVYSISDPLSKADAVGFAIVSIPSTRVTSSGKSRDHSIANAIVLAGMGMCPGSSGGMVINVMGEVIGTISSGGPDTCGPFINLAPASAARKLLEKVNAITSSR